MNFKSEYPYLNLITSSTIDNLHSLTEQKAFAKKILLITIVLLIVSIILNIIVDLNFIIIKKKRNYGILFALGMNNIDCFLIHLTELGIVSIFSASVASISSYFIVNEINSLLNFEIYLESTISISIFMFCAAVSICVFLVFLLIILIICYKVHINSGSINNLLRKV